RHTTKYTYQQPVSSCYNLAYMLPRNTAQQTMRSVAVAISPATSVSHTRTDYFGNQLYQFAIEKDHSELEVTVTSNISMQEAPVNRNLDFGNTCIYARERLQSSAEESCLN